MRAPAIATTAVALAVLLAGCEISVGSSSSDFETSDGAAIEAFISSDLAERSGVAPASISCPSELIHEEGRHYECTVVHPTDGENVIDVTMHAPTGFEWLVR